MTNLYKQAAQEKFRFETGRGLISVEELMDLPLKGNNGVNVDTVAIALSRTIKEAEIEPVSFVDTTKTTPAIEVDKVKLEIVKEIIQDKIEQREALTAKVQKEKETRRIREAIAKKAESQFDNMSIEELQAELAKRESEA